MNIEAARTNMVRQQIRTWDVTEDTVLSLLQHTPRENYVPAAYKDLAFADMSLPLMFGQSMLSPKTEGRMLQGLQLKPDETVLEVGTGSGFFTSLLAQSALRVHTVDIHPELSGMAQHQCQQHGCYNIEYHVGDAAQGWAAAGDVDVIVITGSLPFLPEDFKQQLKPGGRIMAIIGDAPAMEVVVINSDNKGNWHITSLFETVAPVLENALQPPRFIF